MGSARSGWFFARPLIIICKIVIPLVLLAVLAFGVLYVRILNGPVSLSFLVKPIANAMTHELPGLSVVVEDAMVRLNDEGAVEFRLRNVRLFDDEGSPVAVAPLAAVELSRSALATLRLAPSKIVLIEPRLLVSHSAEGGLALSFARPLESASVDETRAAAGTEAAKGRGAAPVQDTSGLPSVLRQIDVARVVAESSARARRGLDATSYLRQFGFRNATVVFDHGGRQSIWRVQSADLDLEHRRNRSVISGVASVASDRGPWTIDFHVEDSEKSKTLGLKASVRGLIPRSLARALPNLAVLEVFDMPVGVEAALDLSRAGRLLGGTFSLELAQGRVHLPRLAGTPLGLDAGRVELKYQAENRRLDIVRADLAWGKSHLIANGTVATSVDAKAGETWAFEIAGQGGQLAAEDLKAGAVPVDALSMRGQVRPNSGIIELSQFILKAGGAQVTASGAIGGANEHDAVRLDGQIGAMPATVAKVLWPRALAPRARMWVGDHVGKGRVVGGSFKVRSGRIGEEGDTASDGSGRMGTLLTLEAADVQLAPLTNAVPLDIPRVLVRVENGIVEVSAPEASSTFSQGRKLAFRGGRFSTSDIGAEEASGEVAFRVQGPPAAVVDLLQQEAFAAGRLTTMPSDGFDGKFDGQFKIAFPLRDRVTVEDLGIEGRARLTDGRIRQLIGNYDAQGATISFDVNEKAVDAKGEMLVGGVLAKLSWQHIIGAPPEKQPPLRLAAVLDNSDRSQLGLDVNHLVQGDVPVELTVTSDPARPDPLVVLRADLGKADVFIENVAWRKLPGRAAILEFEIAKSTKFKAELQNFKLVGDDIAINGWMGLDAQNRIKEFHFPDFSINVVTRLEIQGVLRNDNVWDVKARGATYDGREFFRSLFSVGQLAESPLPPRKDQSGLDLKAEIDTVLGFSEVSLRGLKMRLAKRGGKLSDISARGTMDGGRPLEIDMQQGSGTPRRLVATSDDAGQAFKLVGFYPSLLGGNLRLEVNLDGSGAVEKSGTLRVNQFRILGDPVVSEVLQIPDETRTTAAKRQYVRQVFEFDWMRMPFSIGHGQFVLQTSEIRGPVLGARLSGKADFRARQVNIGGTYVPLQGLNAAVGAIPGIGLVLAGPSGEGMLGITFAIQGSMDNPQVIVNPLSLVAPGIFREIFQMNNPDLRVTPRKDAPGATPQRIKGQDGSRPAAGEDAGGLSGWSSETTKEKVTKKK
jgi:hypothetical protein